MNFFKKNTKLLIGVLTMFVLVVSATFAYFTISANNLFGSSSISGSLEDTGAGVVLKKVGEGLILDVETVAMLPDKVGNVYTATGTESPAVIAELEVVEEGVFTCEYTLQITDTTIANENDLYNKFQNMTDKSEGQIYLEIDGIKYDFNTENLFTEGVITHKGTVTGIAQGETKDITANITMVNADINQTTLNDTEIKLNVIPTEFNCTQIIDEEVPVVTNTTITSTTGYTTTQEIDVTTEYTADDVIKYCVTEESTTDNCVWQDIPEVETTAYYKETNVNQIIRLSNNTLVAGTTKRFTTKYNLTSGDGEKRVYIYLMDLARNISEGVSDTIILDLEIPTVEVSLGTNRPIGNNWYSEVKIKGNASDTGSGIKTLKYCTTTNETCTPDVTITNNTEVSLSSNAQAQRVCFQATDNVDRVSVIGCSDAYKVDASNSTINYTISTSDQGTNNWYNALTLKVIGTNAYSGITSLSYCITTEETCTPDTEVAQSETEVKLASNTNAQKICSKVVDGKGVESDVICSSSYLVDEEVPTIEVNTSSSTEESNGWYSSVSITGTGSDSASKIASISHCTTTELTCEPNITTSSETQTVTLESNTVAQRVCFKAKDKSGKESETKCSDAYKVDTSESSVNISVESSIIGSNNWYSALTLKIEGTNTISGITSINYCVDTKECTPSTNKSGSSTTVELGNNASAQILCANAVDTRGQTTETVCSEGYLVDKNNPSVGISPTDYTEASNGWYKKLVLTLIGADDASGVNTIKYCTTTDTTCEPGTSVTGESTTVELTSNNIGQVVCAISVDKAGRESSKSCSSSYKVDNSSPVASVTVGSSTKGSGDWYIALSMNISGTNNYSGITTTNYCVTTGSSCTPNQTGDSVTLTSNSSAQKVCGTVTDGKGEVSAITCSDLYYVDTDNPSVAISPTSYTSGENGWYKALTLTFTSSDVGSGVSSIKYCISTSGSACTLNQTISGTTGTVSLSTNASAQTVYYQATDLSGRTSEVLNSTAYKVDNEAPTVSASVNNNNTTSATMTITSTESGTYCVNTNATTAGSCTKTGSINANSSVRTSVFTSDGTYYAHVTDTAGNVGNSSAQAITVAQPAGEYLLENPTTGLNTSTAYSGMYRYIGTTADNYVSLDGVLYRIIGVTSEANSTLGLEAGQLKIIKATSIGKYQWHTDETTDTKWETSDMHAYLQSSSVLGNTGIIPSSWGSKISSVKWYTGDLNPESTDMTASEIYGYEDDRVTTSSSRIALMYFSDFIYAYSSTALASCRTDVREYCTSWIPYSSDSAWTMTRTGFNDEFNMYTAASLYQNIRYSSSFVYAENAVYPVFYLDASVTYVSGFGTSTDPIILATGSDKVAPVINVTSNGDGTMTITSNESGTYCVNTSATSTESCTLSGDIIIDTALTSSALTDGTYYVHVKDSAGNTGHSGAVTIILLELAGDYLLDNPTTGLDTTIAYNGMYRYIGTTANNYVSLDGVLYRIIGVTSEANSTLGLEAGQLKLIKATSIGIYNWHTSSTSNTIWTSSAMYTYLQGSNVLSNTSIIPSGWSSKISSVKWYIGDVQSWTNASIIIGLEDNKVTSSSSKVGLIYLSDYYYAYTAGGTTNCYSPGCSNWMTSSHQWTMTRYGLLDSDYTAWAVYSTGHVYYRGFTLTVNTGVRPVFYLNSSVRYVSGSGSELDPIILS